MLITTILNKQYKFKSFVYKSSFFSKSNKKIVVTLVPRKNGKAVCSCCGNKAVLYDRRDERDFEFIPLWGIKVFFRYKMRRVNCKKCGVKIEKVPWAVGKETLTEAFSFVLADWAISLSWKETAKRFHVSWQKVFHSVEYVVKWGLKHRDLSNITAIGIDEISYRIGHKYITLVYQIDKGMTRLLWAGKDRTVKTLLRFFMFFGKERTENLKFVCSDMWKPYLKVIKKKAVNAINVLDRFHIIQKINKAIDKVRAEEYKKLSEEKKAPVLKNARWCLLKRPENLTEKQEIKLSELLKYNLKSIKAYILKEDFDGLWSYVSPSWAGRFIDRWTKRVMYSQIEPMKKIAKMIRRHKPLILNWFKAKGLMSSGVVEGLNNKIKVTMKKSYGFRTEKCLFIALYHALGDLPVPELTHRFT
jgi:transposase